MKSTSAWSLHMIAGLVLFILLGAHMITMHLDLILGWFNLDDTLPGIDWKNVASRGKHFGMAVFYIVFLGTALYHGLYGARTIFFELGISKGAQNLLTKVFMLGGIGLFIFGSAAAVVFFGKMS